MSFAGPLPPPVVLEHFERILPGAANRILAYAEDQLRHRRLIETRLLQAKTRAMSRGQWLGFTVVLVGMGIGAWLVRNGYGIYGFGSILAPLTATAALFVLSRRRQGRERAEKRASLANR